MTDLHKHCTAALPINNMEKLKTFLKDYNLIFFFNPIGNYNLMTIAKPLRI